MKCVASGFLGLALAAVVASAAVAADACFDKTGDAAIAACTRQINSGEVKGSGLAGLYNARAIEYRQKGIYDKAIADYTEAMKRDRTRTGTYTGRGLAYEGKGELDKAKGDYKKALTVPPKYDDGKWAHDVARDRLKALADKK